MYFEVIKRVLLGTKSKLVEVKHVETPKRVKVFFTIRAYDAVVKHRTRQERSVDLYFYSVQPGGVKIICQALYRIHDYVSYDITLPSSERLKISRFGNHEYDLTEDMDTLVANVIEFLKTGNAPTM